MSFGNSNRTPLERSLDDANATVRKLSRRKGLSKAGRRQLAQAREKADQARSALHRQREAER